MLHFTNFCDDSLHNTPVTQKVACPVPLNLIIIINGIVYWVGKVGVEKSDDGTYVHNRDPEQKLANNTLVFRLLAGWTRHICPFVSLALHFCQTVHSTFIALSCEVISTE